MTNAWFKPKSKGYGATPANWKGGLAMTAFLALQGAAALLLFGWQPDPASGPSAWKIAVWTALVTASSLAFVKLCRAKTDGQWAWRWGK